ncbi:TRAP dicarboxylate transporter subunit DctM [Glycocaulis alkaliphilus]|uniref:TRAP dicarboxylate transporter subunit DctM n=1 Tax=Glycocaulis alkaliphilus TaxID=1434191 RepID=A0A3T0EAN4_9PROT|nr:TRAP transporter large permease subunit [Glycocaulis alkaliphilus]AZU04216.1 TRAP dicarboxylate transporter subunit DctM [Glycocaulis alkaliphilus]GGB76748.1 C4-dicarboxylate ABC transporter [Glycocaulis alkaliphilus]
MDLLLVALPFLMFVTAVIALLRGFPVAFTLAGVAILFALIGLALDAFDPLHLRAFPQRIYGNIMEMDKSILVAVPLFVFMGVMLEKSRVAEELLEAMGALFGSMRGGLGISVVIVGALLAASTGIVGATVVTMGLLSLPTMLRRGYDPALASGSIAASGTLGQIIPPSIVLILLGDQLGSAYARAQREQGIFAPDILTVGDLFAGALIPGLLLVGAYIVYQIVIAIIRPAASPAIPKEELNADIFKALRALIPPLALIVAVLGSILAGLATPTEAAGVGALGATLLAGFRNAGASSNPRGGRWLVAIGAISLLALIAAAMALNLRAGVDGNERLLTLGLGAVAVAGTLWALIRLFRTRVLDEVMTQTARISSMVFVILIGASLFALVFRELGGDGSVRAMLEAVPGGVFGAVLVVMLIMFVLGFFLDFIEITFVVVPIVAPILFLMGVDPIWLGVLMALNLQTSFLTPPFGFALFYLRGVAPPSLPTSAIYRGAIPFVIIQLFAIALVAALPWLATALPRALYG